MSEVKLNVGSFGIAIGAALGIFMFLLGLSSWLFNLGSQWVNLISSVYVGFDYGFFGSILGAIYGFIDGFLFGIIASLVYNKLQNKVVS